jgi:hypothetical protein
VVQGKESGVDGMKFICKKCDKKNPCVWKCPGWDRDGDEHLVNRCPAEDSTNFKGTGRWPKAKWEVSE